jgi:hypothetical protein
MIKRRIAVLAEWTVAAVGLKVIQLNREKSEIASHHPPKLSGPGTSGGKIS